LMVFERNLLAEGNQKRPVACVSELSVTYGFVHWLGSPGVEYTKPGAN